MSSLLPITKAALKRIERIEKKISQDSIENAYFFDIHGNVLFHKTGSKDSIGFTIDEMTSLRKKKNLIHTHNHPSCLNFSNMNPRSFGDSFSCDDLYFGADLDVSELRVVTHKRKFIIKPVKKWGRAINILQAYCRKSREIYNNFNIKIVKHEYSINEASVRNNSEIVNYVAKRFNLSYREEFIDPYNNENFINSLIEERRRTRNKMFYLAVDEKGKYNLKEVGEINLSINYPELKTSLAEIKRIINEYGIFYPLCKKHLPNRMRV